MRCSRGQGRNIGVRASHGKYIIFTDGDAIPQNDWIRKMAGALDECDLVAGKTVSMESKGTSNLPRVALYFKGFEITLPSMNLGIKCWHIECYAQSSFSMAYEIFQTCIGIFRRTES